MATWLAELEPAITEKTHFQLNRQRHIQSKNQSNFKHEAALKFSFLFFFFLLFKENSDLGIGRRSVDAALEGVTGGA